MPPAPGFLTLRRKHTVNLQAVILRELKAASRHPATWGLRLAYAGGGLAACGFGWLLPGLAPQDRGQTILACLAGSGLALSLAAGPYLTADSVSVEKREGTLGLLFLTPLRGWEILLGKMGSHALQVGWAWLAILPVLFLPLLQGGVRWTEAVRLLLALLVTLLVSLACGLLWSTVCREARTAVVGTATSLLFLTFLPWAPALVRGMFFNQGFLPDASAALSPLTLVVQAFEAFYGRPGNRGSPPGGALYWGGMGAGFGLGVGMVGLAGWLLPALWRRTEAGARRSSVHVAVPAREAGSEPTGQRGQRWWGRRDLFPCRWWAAQGLEEGWLPRLFRWTAVLFFGVMLWVSVATRHWESGFSAAFGTAWVLHVITRTQLSLAATRRWSEDRRSGAFELLLVTPVSAEEVIAAQLDALRTAFRRARLTLLAMNAALLLMIVLFPRQLRMQGGTWQIFLVFFAGGAVLTLADFPALRWLGLREALRAPSQVKAAARAFGWVMVIPWLAFGVTFLAAVHQRAADAAVVFLLWVLGCLVYDFWLVGRSRLWLMGDLRRRVAEGDGARRAG